MTMRHTETRFVIALDIAPIVVRIVARSRQRFRGDHAAIVARLYYHTRGQPESYTEPHR